MSRGERRCFHIQHTLILHLTLTIMPFTPPSEGELYPTFAALKLAVKEHAGSEGYAEPFFIYFSFSAFFFWTFGYLGLRLMEKVVLI